MTEQSKKKRQEEMLRESGLTYDDYAAFDDGNRYELVDGRLELMSPGPMSAHQLISRELERELEDTCSERFVIMHAPIDLILSKTDVRQPDIVLIRKDRFQDVVAKHGIVGVPDVVVEILSPATLRRDKRDKLRTYAKYGIPEYWIVDPVSISLDQYLLVEGHRYELAEVYQGSEPVQSPNAPCANLKIGELTERMPKLKDD
ncbi:MAG TPA: Uma2 family endonuclease [Paenibacillus sp.]|nr:Uma2 family endonuclease [Paenibacillus sp.]